ncbi:SDR family NAD(P)-dependent oxidoreductase [Micromonospora sp. LOL_023]|uniref:SDR family NAD(P)-dependent oxidoreductase n=1 Tax=Micromonospora sp. LOL_023 TaxID=3345418 RepID=UPI003A8A6F4D
MAHRLAVISGGGTGIGAAAAQALADDGYQVWIIGRRAQVLAEAARRISERCGRPDAVVSVAADLTDPVEVDRVRDTVGDQPVDVLVNNAGAYVRAAADATTADTAANWRATFDVNVVSAVLLTEALRPVLRRPGGRVILMSSIAAQRGGGGPYSAAKAALHGWVFDLAARFGPEGITANVISPGYVADTEFFTGRMTPQGHQSRVDATLVGRAGTPDDIAAAVRYLASPAAGFVTGQIIGVNGGSVYGR